MKLPTLLIKLQDDPRSVTLNEVLDTIAEHYEFTPAGFTNGDMRNEAGESVRSCQLYAFGFLNKLTTTQMLACFGGFYWDDVLKNPDGTDHQTIREFMKHGWEGVRFDAMPLRARA